MINVLIVDDDLTMVEVIRDKVNWDTLAISNVYTAFNVASAKLILSEVVIDIVISDIEMPQESGLDLLKWIRDKKFECECLLLTCHENFDFATKAINYQVAAYLTKPFEHDVMEMNLRKIITKLNEKRVLAKNSNYGVWMQHNMRYMKLDFWKLILSSTVIDEGMIERESVKRQLDFDQTQTYYIICTRLNNTTEDIARYGKDIYEFILEGFHSEIITGYVSNESVIKYSEETLFFTTVCREADLPTLEEKCKQLQATCQLYFSSVLTICISDGYKISRLSSVRERIFKLMEYQVSSYGKIFYENTIVENFDNNSRILDLEKLKEMVSSKDKGQILYYIKQVFHDLMNYNKLNVHSLYLIKQEIIQVIYGYLSQMDIQVIQLFQDQVSVKLSEDATNSMIDMIRWLNNLLEVTYAIEEKNSLSMTIVEKINAYIHQHYYEDIGRNELAEIFFLSPEYLAKLYKKKTGINLIDYINQYRIEQAKELFRTSDLKISEVSEKVGFSNFSYFSTMFKKITGETPKNFKSTCF